MSTKASAVDWRTRARNLSITGEAWKKHLKSKEEADKKKADADKDAAKKPAREKTKAELRKEADDQGQGMEMRRRNAQKLIRFASFVVGASPPPPSSSSSSFFDPPPSSFSFP